MLVSPHRVCRLPLGVMGVFSVTAWQYDAVLAVAQGQPILPSTLDNLQENSEELLMQLSPVTSEDMLEVECSDVSVKVHRGEARRMFQFFDDFCSELDGPARWPSTSEVLLSCIMPNRTPLRELYKYLCILNPYDNLYPFRFRTNGMPPERLIELANKLSEDDRADVLARYRMNTHLVPLPKEGVGIGILGALLSESDEDNRRTLFPEYTSYLAGSKGEVDLSVDYSRDQSYIDEGHAVCRPLFISILNQDAQSVDQMRRKLSMLGLKHERFGNLDTNIPMPYHIDPALNYSLIVRTSRFVYRDNLELEVNHWFKMTDASKVLSSIIRTSRG